MSEPTISNPNKFIGATLEIVSAMSALNMPPQPLEKPKGEYLSQSDHWVNHAMEHLRAALDYITECEKEINSERASRYVAIIAKDHTKL